MIAFTKTLARDLGPYGVTVNAIAPGQIDTRMGTAIPGRLSGCANRSDSARAGWQRV